MKANVIVASLCVALVSIEASNAAVFSPQVTAAPLLQKRTSPADEYLAKREEEVDTIELIGVPASITSSGDTESAVATATSVANTTTSARGPITLSNGNVIIGVSFSIGHGSYEPVSTSGSDGSLVPASTTVLSGNPLLATGTNSVLTSSDTTATATMTSSSSAASASITSQAATDGSSPGMSLNIATLLATTSSALIAACFIL